MRSISFYKKDGDLQLKYNISKFWSSEAWIAVFFFGTMAWIEYLCSRGQPSFNTDEFKMMGFFFIMYLIPFLYRVYKFLSKGILVLQKTEQGYILQKKGIENTPIINRIISQHQTGKYDEGFDVSVRDINKDITTLFTHLPKDDAMALVVFLASELNVIIEQLDVDL